MFADQRFVTKTQTTAFWRVEDQELTLSASATVYSI
jgi:hypothetical protein